MTNGVTASIGVRVTATDNQAPPVGGANQQVNLNEIVSFSPGNGGPGLADKLLTFELNIAASGALTIDLSTAVDAFGVAAALLFVQALYLEADAGNANEIVLGNAGSDPWVGPFDAGTDTQSVKPGGVLLWADPTGWPVVPSTAMNLKLANSGSGTAVTGTLVIVGRSA